MSKKIRRRNFGVLSIVLMVGAGSFLVGSLSFLDHELGVVEILKTHYPKVTKGEDPRPVEVQWVRVRPSQWVPYSEVAPIAIHAIVISEDWSFFQHKGYDPQQISEAIKVDWEKRKFVRGASTITQQVVKNLFLTQDKTIGRKVRELCLAIQMEKTLTKKKILELYLNIAEWGPGIFGIGPASQNYFGKNPSELSAKEGAFLAMLLPSPNRYSQSFRKRELTSYAEATIASILEKLLVTHRLTPEEYEFEKNKSLVFR